jgi:hypothetical protein
MGRASKLVAASLLATTSCGPAILFSYPVPTGVPNTKGWEMSEAWAELDHPRRTVEYQLFVSPKRQATYEVIRYRLTYADPADGARSQYTPNERLQWDLDGRTLRRFELVPGSQGLKWEEIAAGSDRYTQETAVILALLGLHRQLLFSRRAEN